MDGILTIALGGTDRDLLCVAPFMMYRVDGIRRTLKAEVKKIGSVRH